jgi:rhodanese-related sulfurtransferase
MFRLEFPWWISARQIPRVSPADLQRWLAEGHSLQIVDARTGLEFRKGTIAGALHAPLVEMPLSMQRLGLQTGKPVVVLCLSGHRSLPGTRWLRERGYEAYSLEGGLMAWKKAGFKLNPPAG